MAFQRYVTLVLWVLFGGLFFSVAGQWTNSTSADRQLTEYTEGLVRRAALERRPAKDVRSLVLIKAGELSIPVQNDGISVTGQGETLGTVIAYDKEIKIPVVNSVLYRIEFSHSLHSNLVR